MALRMGIGLGLSRSAMLPALSLGFLGETLDPRITFSRGSNATLVDATGKITYAPANLLAYSQEFDNTYWLKTGAGTATAPVVTANAGTAPNGTNTAERVQFDCVNAGLIGNRSTITPVISYPAAVTYVASVWVKAFDAGNVGKTIRFAVDGVTNAVFTITADWQRISLTGLASIAVTNFILEARGTFTTQTADILVWGAQLEPVTYQTTPSTYVATTASAYYGPRFDYDPVTLAPKGLLIEEQRVNLLTGSADFTATYWPTATNIVVTADNTTSPDGTSNADRLADNTTAGVQHRIYRDYTFASATAHTLSVYAKRNDHRWLRLFFFDGTTSFYANFDLLSGVAGNKQAAATSTITNAGNGWYRCTLTATVAAAVGNVQLVMLASDDTGIPSLYTGTGTSLWAYGAQLELGAFATSYIPTVASTVTRSADVATMTGTNFSSWYNQSEGTFVVNADVVGSFSNYPYMLSLSGQQGMFIQPTNILGVGRIFSNDAVTANTTSLNTLFKGAGAYSPSNPALATLNGGAVGTGTEAWSAAADQLRLGANVINTRFLNGHIRQIAYYNTRLPNAQLQSLTA